jgi:hypothetical protein
MRGLEFASIKVMVIVEVAEPSATTLPVPVIDELATFADPAIKLTDPSLLEIGVVIERVFVSALVEVIVQVEIPELLVTLQPPYIFVEPVSVALNVGVVPETGFEFVSLKVIVIVEDAEPSATTDPVPVIFEVAVLAAPAMKVTLPSALMIGVAIESVLTSALVEVIVQVETPELLLTLHPLYTFVLPVSVAEKVGVVPAIGFE